MKARDVAIQAYLHLIAFALVALGAVNLLGYRRLEQPTLHSVALLPDSSWAAILLGLCLLAAVNGRRRLCLATALPLLALCSYSLIHNIVAGGVGEGVSLLSGFLRMRSGLAAVLILLVMAVLSRNKILSRTIGFLLLCIGLAALLSGWWPGRQTITLGFKSEATYIAGLFTLTLGAVAWLLPRPPEPLLDKPSLGVGALGAVLACVVWFQITEQNTETLLQQSELLLSQTKAASERAMADRLALIKRMAERWSIMGELPSPRLWEQEAGSYLRDTPDLRMIGVLNQHLGIHHLHARRPTGRPWLEAFLVDPTNQEWLRQAQRSGRADVSRALLREGAPNALVAVPLELAQRSGWLLVASLNVPDMLGPLLKEQQSNLKLRIFEKNLQILGPESPGPQAPAPIGELAIELPNGEHWRLASYRDESRPRFLPSLVLLFGLAFSYFLMLSQRLARIAIERSETLHQTNSELEASLKRQSSLQALNQRILECSLDMLCSIDAQGCFTQVSPSSRALLGYLPDEMIGRPYLDFVQPENHAQAALELQAIVAGNFNQTMRHACRRKDGSTVYLLWSASWSTSDDSLFAVAHDITPIVQNEAYAEDQRDILSMISTDQPLEEILTAICRMAEAQDPTALCLVMLMDEQHQHLTLGAGPSLPEGYRRTLKQLPIGPMAASCGTAVYLRQMVVVEDIASDPLWRTFREDALKEDLRACWSIPLISHRSEVLGSLAIYHRHPMVPDDDQIQLIATASQLAAIALARQQDRMRLQESEQRYRSLFTYNPDPVFSLDMAGQYQSMNQAGCALSGYAEEDLLGKNFSVLGLPEDIQRIREHFRAARQGEPQHFEAKCRSRKGEVLELDVTNLPIKVGGQIVGVFGIAKDISERNRITRALREALQHSERQAELLRGLNDTALNMSGILDGAALLDYLAERLRLVIGAHQARIELYPHGGLAAMHAESLSEKYDAWSDPLEGTDHYTRMCATNQPILLSQAELETGAGSNQQPSPRGWLAVPLKSRNGQNLGLLQLSDRNEGDFNQDDLAVAQQFAQMTVAVLENNRLMNEVLAGEQRLQAQLDFTSAITDSITEGLAAIDSEGRLTFVNPAAARLIGKPADALLGHSLAALLPLPATPWRTSADLHGEFRFARADGSELYMAYDGAPLLSAQGASGWVLAFRDVSAQRRADQAMRERNQFFTLSLEMFCMIDLQGRFIQVNPAFSAVLGYPPEDLIGKTYLELIANEDRPAMYAAIRQMSQGQPIHDLEARARDSRGQWHWLQLSAAQGEDEVIYCAARDVSERKAAEQALQDSLRELERSNQELQEFAFVASHDLQEPLRKIQAFSERLQSRAHGLDDEGRDFLQRMSSAAERMQSLIRDLLAYSRVTSRAQPFQRLSLERILDEVLQDLETALESSGAEVEREPLPTVDGDPLQMRQLLQNLLSNAIKFHREGEPPRIRVYAETQTPGEWTLCVADQGIGFEEKYLDRIFHPFQRLHGRQTYPGTGIGLAIVKKIVERHGARITASSSPGQGTTFRISFKMPV